MNPNESWFLHNSSGQRLTSPGDWYYMNPASTGWRNYMVGKVGRYFSEFPGLDGIFLDETWNTAVTARNAGCVESICQSDTAWHDATLADLQAIKAAMPAGKKLSMNSDNTSDYAGPMDGFMIEFFANGWCGTCYQSQTDLEQRLNDVDAAVAAGKSVLLVGQGSVTQIESMRYSHALYLMVAGPNVSYRYGEDYSKFLDYPEFSWNLGLPSGPRFKPAPTVFERDFASGKALANVSGSSSVTLNLGGSYLLPNGSSASTVTLAPHQGMALRVDPSPPPPPPPPSATCVVPKVVGKSLADTKRKLAASHCRTGSVGHRHAHLRRGLVYWQSRRPGARLPGGTKVGLRVSLGPAKCAVPKLVGKALAKAKRETKGLTL